MSADEELRSWIRSRREELHTRLLDDLKRGNLGALSRNKSVAELARLKAIAEILGTGEPERPRRWRWSLLAVGVASALLILLTTPHFRVGELALSAQAEGVRFLSAGPANLGPGNLNLHGFRVREVRRVVAASDAISGPLGLDLAGGILWFDDKATLAIVAHGGGSEVTLNVTSPLGLVLTIAGRDVHAEVSPNGGIVRASNDSGPCVQSDRCKTATRNIRVAGAEALEIYLQRPLVPAASQEDPLLRIAGNFDLVTFEARSDHAGLATGRRSQLIQATMQLMSFGDETLTRHWRQALGVKSADGILDIALIANTLKVRFNGSATTVLGSGEEILTPSMLAWLWQNKVIALYLGAFLGIFGFVADRIPTFLEKIRS
jgi:hypothetical protein